MKKWKPKHWRWSAAAMALLSGCSSQPATESAPTAATTTPVPTPSPAGTATAVPAIETSLTILHQSNRYGSIDPCGCSEKPYGGLDREANAVRALRAEGKSVLYVDSGNLFAHAETKKSELLRKRGRAIVGMLNAAGLDYFAPGPGDYKLGLDYLREIAGKAKFKLISTNVVDESGKPVFAQYVVEKRGPVTVGVLSLTNPEKLNVKGVKALSPEATLTKILPELKAKGVDMIVLLSQVSRQEAALAKKFTDIRIVVSSDAAGSTDEAIYVANGKALIVDTTDQGHRLGRLDVTYRLPFRGFTNAAEVESTRRELSDINAQLAKSPSDPLAKMRRDWIVEGGRPLDVVEGGSTYHAELIDLDPKRFGTRNDVTALIEKEKERVRREAVAE